VLCMDSMLDHNYIQALVAIACMGETSIYIRAEISMFDKAEMSIHDRVETSICDRRL